MTKAFETFLKEHGATGSEKADGYSSGAFEDLDEHERRIVFDMLVKELPWSAKWLFHVDKVRAIPVVKKYEQEMRGLKYSHAYMLQEQLIKNTGEIVYQENMIYDYRFYDEDIKPKVVRYICKTPLTERVLDFLQEVILTEANASAVMWACRGFLDAAFAKKDNDLQKENYELLLNSLCGNNLELKLDVIKKLRNYL